MLNMGLQCVVTGCAVIVNDRWVAGDLFQQGETFIFNGNWEIEELSNYPEPAWQTGEPFYPRQINLTGHHYWERRAVFVFSENDVTFNLAILEYMKR